jgi:hypothetical protein
MRADSARQRPRSRPTVAAAVEDDDAVGVVAGEEALVALAEKPERIGADVIVGGEEVGASLSGGERPQQDREACDRRAGEGVEDGVRQCWRNLAGPGSVPLELPVDRPPVSFEGRAPAHMEQVPLVCAYGDAADGEHALVRPSRFVDEEQVHGRLPFDGPAISCVRTRVGPRQPRPAGRRSRRSGRARWRVACVRSSWRRPRAGAGSRRGRPGTARARSRR